MGAGGEQPFERKFFAVSPSGFRISSVSARGGDRPSWAVVVFAYNESRRIRAALESVARAAGGHDIEVVVLANGCRDHTARVVRACADVLPRLTLVEIDLPDKANAWNVYVHEVLTADRVRRTDVHFFTDGDVRIEPDALPLLASALREVPSANAAGAIPATGRDRDAWRARMVANGNLAGNLYALRGNFVERVRQRRIRMPIGLFGEDRFVSWLAATDLGAPDESEPGPRCVFHGGAQFSFRSLSPWRIRDYRIYLRRKWRYTRRALQHEMLMRVIAERGLSAMPHHIQELYRTGPYPSRLRWVGRDTPLRMLAILWMRWSRTRDSRRHVAD